MAGTDSAGIALCRTAGLDNGNEPQAAEILLVHPGGPFWAGKDEHAWSIPKGEFEPLSEESDVAARREFSEELGTPDPTGSALFLGSFKAGRKTIWPWLLIVDGPVDSVFDHPPHEPFSVESNLFELEWPPKSGTLTQFPEVDVAQWVELQRLQSKLHKGQAPLVSRLADGLRAWSEQPHSFSTW